MAPHLFKNGNQLSLRTRIWQMSHVTHVMNRVTHFISQITQDVSHSTHVTHTQVQDYGGASISGLLKSVGLFCTRALLKRLYSAKETYNFKEPTNRSHPIAKFELLTLALSSEL